MKVKDVMSRNVVTVNSDTSIEEIANILVEKNISGVPVVNENNKVIGIVTHKDLLYKDVEPRFPAVVELLGGLIFLKGVKHYNEELRKLVATKAEDIMTNPIITIDEDDEIEKAAQLMVENDINRIPVLNNGNLTGIVSRADVIRYMAKRTES